MSEGQGGSTAAKGCILVVFAVGVLGVVGFAAAWIVMGRDKDGGGVTPVPVPAPNSPPVPTPVTPEPALPATGAALDRIKTRGRLLVAMDTGEPPGSGTPPMYFLDSQGGRDGLDYALSRRIADAVGVHEVEIVHVKYSGAEDLLLDRTPRVDLLISGYSPTETPGVAWSDPYLEYGLCLVVTAGSDIHTTNDLFGKAVGIFDDDAAAADVQHLVKGYTSLVRLEDGYWDALLAGKFAGFLYDFPYTVAELQNWYAAHPDKRGAFRIAQYNLTDSEYAVGVRATEPDLLAAVNTAIQSWRGSDDYPVALKRYLKGAEATAVTDTRARKVTVKKGDTLSGIAQRELGDKDRWKELWKLNQSRFPNPHLIEVGDEVILP